MNKISIVGKNSKVYQLYKSSINKVFKIDKEISHKEINEVDTLVNPIIFSFDNDNLSSNFQMLNQIKDITKGKIIYISTSAIYSMYYSNGYKYPSMKLSLENFIKNNFEDYSVLRLGVIKELKDESFLYGKINLTDEKIFINSLSVSLNESRNVNSWTQRELPSNFTQSASLNLLHILSFILKRNFYFTRPLDLILKILKLNQYGYTYLSNYKFQSKQVIDEIIIGSGMGALGLLKKNKNKNITVIDCEKEYDNIISKNFDKIILEKIGNGGNSSKWHGGISYYQLDRKDFSKKFSSSLIDIFNLNANTIENILSKDYCFIPFYPIRPLKAFKRNKNIVNINAHINKIEMKDKYFKLDINNQEILTSNLNLCTGSISSLNILYRSNLLKSDEVLLSDHMIGYFGQIKLNSRPNLVKYILKGHLKRSLTINLNDEKNIYLTLRPAYGIFKNIKKAEEFRSFFNDASISIISKLFKKIFSPLILEAFYNKFGVFIHTGTYNLTGHVEIKDALKIKLFKNKNPDVKYLQNSLRLTELEKAKFKTQLSKIFDSSSVSLQDEVKLDPGLHFLNARYLNGELLDRESFPFNIKSTIFFKDYHPQHPTFSLLVEATNY